MRKQNGITLVALVITIIVLLILAVVTIAAVTKTDVLGHAENATEAYKDSEKREENALTNYATDLQAAYTNYTTNVNK